MCVYGLPTDPIFAPTRNFFMALLVENYFYKENPILDFQCSFWCIPKGLLFWQKWHKFHSWYVEIHSRCHPTKKKMISNPPTLIFKWVRTNVQGATDNVIPVAQVSALAVWTKTLTALTFKVKPFKIQLSYMDYEIWKPDLPRFISYDQGWSFWKVVQTSKSRSLGKKLWYSIVPLKSTQHHDVIVTYERLLLNQHALF